MQKQSLNFFSSTKNVFAENSSKTNERVANASHSSISPTNGSVTTSFQREMVRFAA